MSTTTAKRPREEEATAEADRTAATATTTNKKETVGSSSKSSQHSYHQLYSHQGAYPTDPNYLFFRASPAMLFLLRGAQEAPYAGVSRHTVAAVAQPQDYSLRPAPVLSLRATIHFYERMNHQCGVEVAAPQQLELRTLGAHAHGGQGLSYVKKAAAGGGVSPTSMANNNNNSGGQQPMSLPPGRLCHFYGTKEGCRRGDQCEYVHLDKDGRVVAPGDGGHSHHNNNNNNNNNNSHGSDGKSGKGGSASTAMELLLSLTKK